MNASGSHVRTPRRKRKPASSTPSAPRPAATPGNLGWAFGYVFKEAHRAFSTVMTSKLKPLGITLSQWYFLRELWDQEGLTQRELSRRLGITEASTTSAIELLVREELVERRRKPGDHRSQYLFLTRAGRSLRERALAGAHEVNAMALKGFSETEIAELRQRIFRMIGNLRGRATGEAPASPRRRT